VQLQKSEDASPDIKEFDHLKEHFEKFLRYNTPQSLPTSFLSLSSSGSFSKMGYNSSAHNRKSNLARMDDVGEYKASEYIPHNDMEVMDNLINLQEDTTGETIDWEDIFICIVLTPLRQNSVEFGTEIQPGIRPTV
jgi:hypothetical protein